jgi:hypothetical protein
MKLTINIADEKAAFFLELLKSFDDFVTVEKPIEANSISDAHKSILDERLAAYDKAPDAVLDWETVKKEIEQTL